MRYIYKLILSTVLGCFVVTACDTDALHELNVNPQALKQIDLHYLFTAAELSLASNGTSGDNRYTDWRTNIGLASTAMQHLATTGSISAAGMYYRHNEETASAPFEFIYNDQLKNIAEILKQTGPGGFAEGQIQNTVQASRILKAWSFQRLTDFYGPVPYVEANRGIDDVDDPEDGIIFPKYDNQSFIYGEILKELDEATAGLSTANVDPGFAGADMIYKGDIVKWKRFGYSLMLRAAMRISNIDLPAAQTYVAKAIAGGVFKENADNVWIQMNTGPSEWTNQNGISRAFYPGDGGNAATLAETLVDFLKGADPNSVADDDPRLMIFTDGIGVWSAASWAPTAKKRNPLNQLGFPSGRFQSTVASANGWPPNFQIDTTFSRINPYMLDDGDPYMIMNHAEVEFLLAEAAERGIGGATDAEMHYNAGVKSAMQMLTPYFTNNANFTGGGVVSDAQVATYLATYPYGDGGVTGDESPLEQIGYQMWASKYMNWWEAWVDWRRTGYPELVEYTDDGANVTNGKIPVRLPYPSTETVINPNFDQFEKHNYTTPVWWDGGPE